MAKAYRCDFCGEYQDGAVWDKVPETWALAPSIHVDRTFGLNLIFSMESKSLNAELCIACARALVIEGLEKLLEAQRAALSEGAEAAS
jgi:hypothetical protein